jgi:trypsin
MKSTWLVCSGILLSSLGVARVNQSRIVGGLVSNIQNHSYIVSLQLNNSHYCGGALIKENYVLTAGHCVNFLGPRLPQVVIGSQTHTATEAGAELHNVRKIILHPGFLSTDEYLSHDFALLELDTPSARTPVSLIEESQSPFEINNGEILAMGWGRLAEGAAPSTTLMEVKLPLVTKETCSAAYPNILDSSMICAGVPQGGIDTCQGDSGGPIVAKNAEGKEVQVGVVSWGSGCARPNMYGVYANVALASNWIAENINAQ